MRDAEVREADDPVLADEDVLRFHVAVDDAGRVRVRQGDFSDAASLRHPIAAAAPRRPLVPLIVNAPGGQLSFLSTIAHFGTSEDVTVRDLRLELLFPADDATRAALKAMAS